MPEYVTKSAAADAAEMNPSVEKYRLLVEGVRDHAIFMMDPHGTIMTWNSGVESILGYSRAEWVGQHGRIIFTPEDRASGETEKEQEKAVREGRAADVRRHIRADGSRFWADGVLERLDGDTGECVGFVKVLRDATHEKESAQRVLEGEEKYRTLFESIDVGFCIIQMLFDEQGEPRDYRFLEANPAFERHTGLVNAQGKTVRELVPALDDFWFRTYGDVALTGESLSFENHAPAMGRWFDVYALRIGPAQERKVGLLFTDITSRKEAQEALRQSEERLRESEERVRSRLINIFTQAPAFMAVLRGPTHVFDLANPPYYQLVGHREIIGKPVVEALPEVVDQGFVKLLDQVYQTGEAFVGAGVSILLQTEPDGPMEERFLDFTYQPLFEPEGTVSGVLAHGIDLTERRRLELERERLLEEQRQLLAEARARAEREAIVNQIGEAVRAALEPAEVLAVTVEALGKALRVDRCYFVTYDRNRDLGRIETDWYPEGSGLSSLAGEFRLSNIALNQEARYQAGQTQVVDDVHEQPSDVPDAPAASTPLPPGITAAANPGMSLMDTLGLRSMIRAPLLSAGAMTALTVAMANGPRHWTEDEVHLVETVAAQTRAAVEAARIQQRERTIAQQLQDALQPPLPPHLPGMKLASFYRTALEEAGVGGDFYDVFSVEKGCTALIVADLSGKGLSAASEVATVRNMARYALYTATHIADAVNQLNHLLVEHDLLTGFATAFLGVYDHAEKTLTYVNCGQEPGLIWRADTGYVEELGPTGPVLGGFGDGSYKQVSIRLHAGDILALFTDGMTEVGATRKELLEVEGVTRLLKECAATSATTGNDPQAVVDCLVAGADAFSAGGVRDDIALLVGVINGTAEGRNSFTGLMP